MLKQVALILCLHTIGAAAAQAADCKSDNLSQTDMDVCAGEAFKAADAQLNARYKKIVGCPKDAAEPLAEAQRAWIKFRDAECKFQGSAVEGGSAQPMVVAECLKTVTQQRSKDLNYYLTCEEGDLSCPTFTCGFHKGGGAPK